MVLHYRDVWALFYLLKVQLQTGMLFCKMYVQYRIVRSNSSMLIIDFISYFGTLLMTNTKCKWERKSNLFVIIPYYWCAISQEFQGNKILETNVACLKYSKKPPISITKYLGRLVDFFWYFIFLRSLFWLCKSTKCFNNAREKVLKNTSKNDTTFDRNTRTVG